MSLFLSYSSTVLQVKLLFTILIALVNYSPFVVHVEEFAGQLVDRVSGFELYVHGQEHGGEEEDGAGQGDQLSGTQFS